MTETFHGGLERPGKLIRVNGPWIVLVPTSSHLDFQMRFRWLRRLFGPWRLERSAVREVYMSPPRALAPWIKVNLLAEENMPWSFLTQHPYDVLACLERLGYPVRAEK